MRILHEIYGISASTVAISAIADKIIGICQGSFFASLKSGEDGFRACLEPSIQIGLAYATLGSNEMVVTSCMQCIPAFDMDSIYSLNGALDVGGKLIR